MSIIIDNAKNGNFTLIAEIGVNFFDIAKKLNISNINAAKLMILEAKNSGIHAVKFQTYKANALATKLSPSYWDTTEEPINSQYELFKKFDTFGYQQFRELADYSNQLGIEFLSTAFDFDSADYLFDLMNVFKISSSDLNNLPFVEYQAKKNKPIILSIGASDEMEIDRTISIIKKFNNKQLSLLHCVLEYPTPYEHANLNRIFSLKKKYPELIIGYSDHTKPDQFMDVIKTAYNLGAIIVEKHFTLDKTILGNDHYHSMEPIDAKKILDGIKFIDSIKGSFDINYLNSEKIARLNARRSLVSLVQIPKGTKITKNMLTFKRPGTGISPDNIDKIIGLKARNNIPEDTTLKFEMFE
jgi:sialic acid synthase SpsE